MSNTPHHTRPIALIGLSGAGKSTVAPLLASRLGLPLHDVDALVSATAGRSIPQIFSDEGERSFRDRESAALAAALGGAAAVVATGAGVILRESNRALLRERALVVWLDAPDDQLIARLRAHAEERPLLAGPDPEARLAAQRAARAALYAEAAHVTIATTGQTPEAICEAIIRARLTYPRADAALSHPL